MLVDKVYNNNVVLVFDNSDKKEYILIGSGLGFQKKKGMSVDESKIEKKFVLDDDKMKNRFTDLINDIEPKIFSETTKVINLMENYLKTPLYQYVYIALVDHIAFAIKRAQEKITIRHPLFFEIKRTYEKEYKASIMAVNHLNKVFDINLPKDEAAFICIHIINSYYQGNVEKSKQDMEVLKILKNILTIIKYYYKIDYKKSGLNYDRLVTHVRFFAKRIVYNMQENYNKNELLDVIKTKYQDSFDCVQKICSYINSTYDYVVSEDEQLYLLMHIVRIAEKFNNNTD